MLETDHMLSHHISLALAREHQRDLLPESHSRAIPDPQGRDIVDSQSQRIPDSHGQGNLDTRGRSILGVRRAWWRLRGLTPAGALCELDDARVGRRGSSIG